MHLEAGLEFTNALLKEELLLLKLGKLLLLQREYMEERADELTNRWRRYRPVLG
jgi:hypothetical protein